MDIDSFLRCQAKPTKPKHTSFSLLPLARTVGQWTHRNVPLVARFTAKALIKAVLPFTIEILHSTVKIFHTLLYKEVMQIALFRV
jgi:hypothetical protein